MIDPTKEMRATDANRLLGYGGPNGVTELARAGKILGARKVSEKIWAIPIAWVQEQQQTIADSPRGSGKPRGHKASKAE